MDVAPKRGYVRIGMIIFDVVPAARMMAPDKRNRVFKAAKGDELVFDDLRRVKLWFWINKRLKRHVDPLG